MNCVAPGFIETAMTADLPEKAKEAMLANIPTGRMGQPAEIAAAVAFLASDEASYLTWDNFKCERRYGDGLGTALRNSGDKFSIFT